MSAACHDLRFCLTVGHTLRFPFSYKVFLNSGMGRLAFCPVLFDGLVLLRKNLPTEGYPHLVDGLAHELLHMETVIYKLGLREHGPYRQHHGRGQIRRHRPYAAAQLAWNLLQYCRHRVRNHATHHRCQGSTAAVGCLVRQDGVNLTVGKAGLVKAHVIAEIVWKQHVLLCVIQLFPLAVVTDLLLVLLAQRLTIETVAGSKCRDAYGGGLNLPLLKKKRTLNSTEFRQTRTNPSRS